MKNRPKTINNEIIKKKLQQTIMKLRQVKKQSKELCEQNLEERANVYSSIHNKEAEKVIKMIKKLGSIKRDFPKTETICNPEW